MYQLQRYLRHMNLEMLSVFLQGLIMLSQRRDSEWGQLEWDHIGGWGGAGAGG